jgi:hypothetical protein
MLYHFYLTVIVRATLKSGNEKYTHSRRVLSSPHVHRVTERQGMKEIIILVQEAVHEV